MTSRDTEILELFDRNVSRPIEEVVKVNQTAVDVVENEIREYVATEAIRDGFHEILEHFQETPNNPHEGIGVWISGFFGAGKSLFAKILGYVLEDRELDGTSAAELFGRQTGDPRIEALLGKIKEQIPTKAVIFDVSTDQLVNDTSEMLTDIVYRVLLRELGYSTNREIAELEIELEEQDRLRTFEETHRELYEEEWNAVKNRAVTARNHASRIRHELDPDTFPEADSWAKTPTEVQVNADFVAERCFDLMQRRGDGKAVVFVVDEVGQYVARSTQKMLDLQGLVQSLGRVGRNKAQEGEWTGQAWLVATSQERLSEVVENLGGKQVELARLRDRFPIEVDLEPSDIREVTSKRVLKKKPEAKKMLEDLYRAHPGRIKEATRLSGSVEGPELGPDSFARLYPFLPYQISLIISIVSGLRTQRGATRHVGGANRTIIKLAQQILINDKTDLGGQEVGQFVTLDMVYDLLRELVTNERRRDVDEIQESFGPEAMPTRVAKALALLEFVQDVPRTEQNLAAVFHPSVESSPLRSEVEEALEQLREVHKARETEDGWELLSRAGKEWEEERRSISVFPKEQSQIVEEIAEQLFEDVPGYRHQGVKTFNVQPIVNGRSVARSGDLELRVNFVTDPEAVESAEQRARKESNEKNGENAIHWVVPVGDEVIRAVKELHRSREMVRRYEQEKPTPEQSQLLQGEKSQMSSHRQKIRRQLQSVFEEGISFLQGRRTPIEEYGDTLRGQVKGVLREAVPQLFPKFEMAAVRVKSSDAEAIVKSESLAGLPSVYYEGDDGLGVVRHEGGEHRIHTDHPVLQEVLEVIQERDSYGEDATGRYLEDQFTGFDYGWDPESLILLTGTLFREGSIEAYKGKRFTSYADPGVRELFRKIQQFRSTTFSPREEGLDFQTRSDCVQALEELTGHEAPHEEGGLARELKSYLEEQAAEAQRVSNILEAEGLPGAERIRQLQADLGDIAEATTADAILSFHKQRAELADKLEELQRIDEAVAPSNRERLRAARQALERYWPELRDVGVEEDVRQAAEALEAQLGSEEFYDHLADISDRTDTIEDAYRTKRHELSDKLAEKLQEKVDALRNRREWEAIDDYGQGQVLAPFAQIETKLSGDRVSLGELMSDLRALDGYHREAVSTLIERFEEMQDGDGGGDGATVRRVNVSDYASEGLRTQEEVEDFLEALREACMNAVAKSETVIIE